ncbi:MAG: hypothetical protein QW478_05245 [Candidatus Micrarchaeaceae archaeon]
MKTNIFEKIKNFLKAIVNFYVEPYQNWSLQLKSQSSQKREKSKEVKEVSGQSMFEIFINYYKRNILSAISQALGIILILFVLTVISEYVYSINLFTQIWFVFLFLISVIFAAIKPGLSYLFERKKEIIDGLLSLLEDYTETADVVSFKHYIESLDKTRYPPIFVVEFLEPLEKAMQVTYASRALKEQLDLPRNNYYEIQKYKDFIVSAIESDDKSIRNALKSALKTSKESRKTYLDKMQAANFVTFIAIGLTYIFPFIFMIIFITSIGTSGITGLSKSSILPTSLAFNLWFIFGIISSLIIIIGSNYYEGKENKAITYGFLTLIVLSILSAVIYVTLMTI